MGMVKQLFIYLCLLSFYQMIRRKFKVLETLWSRTTIRSHGVFGCRVIKYELKDAFGKCKLVWHNGFIKNIWAKYHIKVVTTNKLTLNKYFLSPWKWSGSFQLGFLLTLLVKGKFLSSFTQLKIFYWTRLKLALATLSLSVEFYRGNATA